MFQYRKLTVSAISINLPYWNKIVQHVNQGQMWVRYILIYDIETKLYDM